MIHPKDKNKLSTWETFDSSKKQHQNCGKVKTTFRWNRFKPSESDWFHIFCPKGEHEEVIELIPGTPKMPGKLPECHHVHVICITAANVAPPECHFARNGVSHQRRRQ
jgi:hypothetical protein